MMQMMSADQVVELIYMKVVEVHILELCYCEVTLHNSTSIYKSTIPCVSTCSHMAHSDVVQSLKGESARFSSLMR